MTAILTLDDEVAIARKALQIARGMGVKGGIARAQRRLALLVAKQEAAAAIAAQAHIIARAEAEARGQARP